MQVQFNSFQWYWVRLTGSFCIWLKLKILIGKFTLYFRCKRPSVSLVIFLSISGPTTTAYHCLEMINCSDNTWGFCIPFPFSRLRLCSSSTAGRFCRHYEKHSCVRLGLSDRANFPLTPPSRRSRFHDWQAPRRGTSLQLFPTENFYQSSRQPQQIDAYWFLNAQRQRQKCFIDVTHGSPYNKGV